MTVSSIAGVRDAFVFLGLPRPDGFALCIGSDSLFSVSLGASLNHPPLPPNYIVAAFARLYSINSWYTPLLPPPLVFSSLLSPRLCNLAFPQDAMPPFDSFLTLGSTLFPVFPCPESGYSPVTSSSLPACRIPAAPFPLWFFLLSLLGSTSSALLL